MSVVQVVLFSVVLVTLAATLPLHSGPPACDPNTGIGCMPSPSDCPEGCVCNRTEIAIANTDLESTTRASEIEDDAETESFTRPTKEFKFVKTVIYYGSAGISARLHEKVEYVFRGIIVSAILFIVCACVCVMSVCVYCCHMRRTDHKLKQEVDALAKKLKIDVKKAGPSSRPRPNPKGESCSVLVEDANVMCV